MANGRRWRYPEDFRRTAVERFKCGNVTGINIAPSRIVGEGSTNAPPPDRMEPLFQGRELFHGQIVAHGIRFVSSPDGSFWRRG